MGRIGANLTQIRARLVPPMGHEINGDPCPYANGLPVQPLLSAGDRFDEDAT